MADSQAQVEGETSSSVVCPDGILRHTIFAKLDCARCTPSAHLSCGCNGMRKGCR